MNISNLSPKEVLNYIPMPEQAYTAIETLIGDIEELEKETESLQDTVSDIEDVYHDLESILNNPKNKGNPMLEELIEISNRIYGII